MIRVKLLDGFTQIPRKTQKLCLFLFVASRSSNSTSEIETETDRITRIINNHPFPHQPLEPTLLREVPIVALSTTLLENVLGHLFAAHSNGLKALEFFKYYLHNSYYDPSSDAFEKTLHILTRMRYFDIAWELMVEMREKHPSLLTLKSMSILLSKIAKFQSYEETLEAFSQMEKQVFVGRKFSTDEFNVLLRAFCMERDMKEAKSVFQKMHSRFSPNTKTMNILLLGFKESGDITAMELFYHDMVRRGFKANTLTYNIRIDAYCKKGCFGDALRLVEEMDSVNCFPTLETITTLIHGAGVARNTPKARQLFEEMFQRNLHPDIGVYNALISALIRSKDLQAAIRLMEEMEEKDIGHDNMTYHTMFLGMMKSSGIEGVCRLYNRMIERNFVPKTRTVVMLMKFFCQSGRLDLGLNLWSFLVEKGHCPHSHSLDLLITGLCSRRRLQDAFECSKQMLERGRQMSDVAYQMLERILLQSNETEKLEELNRIRRKLQNVLPSTSRGLISGTRSPDCFPSKSINQ